MKKILIVTGSSNTMGKYLLETSQPLYDCIIGVSRSSVDIPNTINFQCDLTNKRLNKELFENIFSYYLNPHDELEIHLVHMVYKIKNELIGLNKELVVSKGYEVNEFELNDHDGDGIDDGTLHTIYNSLQYTIDHLSSIIPNILLKLGIILSIQDHKYPISPCHQSMIKTNLQIRKYINQSVEEEKINGCCIISTSTVATQSEISRRIKADQEYWLDPKTVANTLLSNLNTTHHIKVYDQTMYVVHPEYESYFKYESSEQYIKRFMYEYGLSEENPRASIH